MSGKKSKSPAPPPLPPPPATPTDMSPEVAESRRRAQDVARKMVGYQGTLLTGPGGLGGSAESQKKQLLGG